MTNGKPMEPSKVNQAKARHELRLFRVLYKMLMQKARKYRTEMQIPTAAVLALLGKISPVTIGKTGIKPSVYIA